MKNKIIKKIIVLLAPIVVSFAIFTTYICIVDYMDIQMALISLLGPILMVLGKFPIEGYLLFSIISITLMSSHIIWAKWYTAILSFIGGLIWCCLGLGAVSAYC